LNFLVDNQLPPALARFLTDHGFPAKHVLDLELDGAPDAAVWRYALEHDMVLASKDDDFLHLAHRPDDLGRLVWLRVGNCRKSALLGAFSRALPQIVAALNEGQRIVEVR
jgi:predicted nuclease of predicted toxin-antitoxin system